MGRFQGIAARRLAGDWGEVAVTPHASGVADANDPAGFHAVCAPGFQQTLLAANMNKGLLIIASYNSFHDGSRRPDDFSREFFYQVDGGQVKPSD